MKKKKFIILLILIILIPLFCTNISFAGPGSGSGGAPVFESPLTVNSVSGLLNSLISNLRQIIAYLAIIFIIIGGIMYMVSTGNPKMMGRATSTITYAIIGLAIALAAPAFLNEILNIIGAKDVSSGSAMTLKGILKETLKTLLSIVGVLAIIALVIGGLTYLTSYGDTKRSERGKQVMTAAIIGIVICFGALVIVKEVSKIVTGS